MRRVLAAIVLAVMCPLVYGADLFIYPKAGQSSTQQHSDESECKAWALDRSGFDPLETPQASKAPERKRGRLLGGAAAGAAVGAIVGNSDDALKGAAIGGLFGGMRQSSMNRKSQAQYEQERQNAEQAQLARSNDYRRAYSACLEARDYTVK